ncbi:matrixin family metalloprotease [Herbaspirillum sp. HC18]|nr:matrixin family metalloprotease [Herbaspirillum sp. HC18]
MASMKKLSNCIGLSGEVSVVRDFFGYWTGTHGTLSLLTQVRLVQGQHVHLNLIRTYPFSDDFLQKIDLALQFMRDVYATVNFGVGRIKHYHINQGGYEIIVGEAVALDLMNSWSVSNDGIDVFMVLKIVGPAAGMSPVSGSCDKDDKNDSGSVIGVLDSGSSLGISFAHEVGHYLGLEHETELPDNLMYPSEPNGAKLYGGQGGVMHGHCAVRAGCPS